jgi:hypothetical protein
VFGHLRLDGVGINHLLATEIHLRNYHRRRVPIPHGNGGQEGVVNSNEMDRVDVEASTKLADA